MFGGHLGLHGVFGVGETALHRSSRRIAVLVVFEPTVNDEHSCHRYAPSSSHVLIEQRPVVSDDLDGYGEYNGLCGLGVPGRRRLRK